MPMGQANRPMYLSQFPMPSGGGVPSFENHEPGNERPIGHGDIIALSYFSFIGI